MALSELSEGGTIQTKYTKGALSLWALVMLYLTVYAQINTRKKSAAVCVTPDNGKKKNKKQGRSYDNAAFSSEEYENCRRDECLYENTEFPAQNKQVCVSHLLNAIIASNWR